MKSQFGDLSLLNGVHGGLEYYDINSQKFIKIYLLSNLHLCSKIKQLILKGGIEISIAFSYQESHHHQIIYYVNFKMSLEMFQVPA